MSTKSSAGGSCRDDDDDGLLGLNLLAEVVEFVSLCKENGCRHDNPSSCYNGVISKKRKLPFLDNQQHRKEVVVVEPRRYTVRWGREEFPSSFEYDHHRSQGKGGLTTMPYHPSMVREEQEGFANFHNHLKGGVNGSIPRGPSSSSSSSSSRLVVEHNVEGGFRSFDNRLQVNSSMLQSSSMIRKERNFFRDSLDDKNDRPEIRGSSASCSLPPHKKGRREIRNLDNNQHVEEDSLPYHHHPHPMVRKGREELRSHDDDYLQVTRSNLRSPPPFTIQKRQCTEEEFGSNLRDNLQQVKGSIFHGPTNRKERNSSSIGDGSTQGHPSTVVKGSSQEFRRNFNQFDFDNNFEVRGLIPGSSSTTSTRTKKLQERNPSIGEGSSSPHPCTIIKGSQEFRRNFDHFNRSDNHEIRSSIPGSSSTVTRKQEEEWQRDLSNDNLKVRCWIPQPPPPAIRNEPEGSRNFRNHPPPQPPPPQPRLPAHPQELAALTCDLRQRIAAATKGRVTNATGFQLAIRKQLNMTDLSKDHARVSLPNSQRSEFLTEAEKARLANGDRLPVGAFVVVGYPNLVAEIEDEVCVKVWKNVCVLAGRGWKSVIQMKKAEVLDVNEGDEVELWRFGYGDEVGEMMMMMGFVLLVNVRAWRQRRRQPELEDRR